MSKTLAKRLAQNHMMHTVAGTLRDFGCKYAHDLEAIQSLADNSFPKPLVYLINGPKTQKIKIFNTENSNTSPVKGEWYIHESSVGAKSFAKLNKFNFKINSLKKRKDKRVLLYLHGGAFILCTHKTVRDSIMRLSLATQLPVLAIDYRKAPRHPFPAPRDDAYATYQWLVEQGFSVVVGGDSAGGNLSLMVTKKAKEEGIALPKSLVLISPWVNLQENHKTVKPSSSLIKNSVVDLLPLAAIESFAKAVLGKGTKEFPNLKSLSPEFFTLSGYPPMLVLTGEYEMLYDQQLRFVANAKAAGVSVQHEIAPGMVHVYTVLAGLGVKRGQEAFDQISTFLKAP